MEKTTITVQATVNAPIEKVWDYWNTPEHIKQWNSASPDWHTPSSENDLRVGGRFTARMEAKDGSFGFDFEAVYDEILMHQKITYTMADGRQSTTTFKSNGTTTTTTMRWEKKLSK